MKLYIIGNGFDIAHDIKCKYCDFRDYLGDNHSNYYESISHGYAGSNYLWKDFENELPSCATHIEEWGLEMGFSMREEIDYDPMDDMGIGLWLDNQYKFLNELPKYLRFWVQSIGINKKPKFKIEKDALFLTFNYTATLEKIYSIERDNINHIHGFVENKNELLIIGHCDQDTISEALNKKLNAEEQFEDCAISTFDRVAQYCETTLKRTDYIIEANSYFFNHLSHIDEIVIIGHSLNEVDMPYFRKVLQSVSPNAVWTACYHDDSDEQKFKNILMNLGIDKEKVLVHKTEELYI